MMYKREGGFSLIELGFVLLIGGLIMTSSLKIYRSYQQKAQYSTTNERLNQLSAALLNYYSVFQRYPCPAPQNSAMNAVNAGREACPAILPAGPALGTCAAGVCRTAGARDADNNPATDDPVLIGTIPYKDLNMLDFKIAMNEADDGFFSRFTYAITESMTTFATFQESQGAILVQDEFGNTLTQPAGNVHLVVVSHGDDGRGAFSAEGVAKLPCNLLVMDGENCDYNDAIFVSGLRSMGNNVGYNDDMVSYRLWAATSLWVQSPFNTNDIYNKNPGNVGIGNALPLERLDVNGNIKVDDVLADTYCDQLGLDCFPSSLIGGAGMSCPAGTAMESISNGAFNCAPLALVGANAGNCNPGEFVMGIDTVGDIICAVP